MKIAKILSPLIAQMRGSVVSVFAKSRFKKNKNEGNNQTNANDCWSFKYGSSNNAGVLQNTFGVR